MPFSELFPLILRGSYFSPHLIVDTTWTPWMSSDSPDDDSNDIESLANIRMVSYNAKMFILWVLTDMKDPLTSKIRKTTNIGWWEWSWEAYIISSQAECSRLQKVWLERKPSTVNHSFRMEKQGNIDACCKSKKVKSYKIGVLWERLLQTEIVALGL